MWEDIRTVYREGLAAARLFPLLFLIPALAEFAQHVVEMNAGMYLSLAAAKASESDPQRMIFGFIKTVALLLPTYWFVRALTFSMDRRAARIEWPAFALWLAIFALNTALAAYTLFGPPLGAVLGLGGGVGKWAGPALSAVWTVIGIYLTAWYVAWPLGNAAIGPVRSIAIMNGSFWRTVGYMIAGVVPLMALHYGLGFLAIVVTPGWLDWAVLALDALVVSWLACTMAGSSYVAARAAAARKGVALTGE